MKNKTLLINPDFVRKIDGQTPLNLAYLAAAIEKYSEVKIIDLNIESENSLDKLLTEFKPTHVGVTRYTPNNIDSLNLLKRIHKQDPSIITITGGPHERFRGSITKEQNPWIDHIVREVHGEQALANIIRSDDKKTVDWKTLFPAYHLLNMDEKSYRFNSDIFPGKKMLQYMGARGCPYQCSMCSTGRLESKEISTVIDHLNKIVEMKYEALFFNDVNFVGNPKHTRNLMNAIIKEGLHKKLEWGCQTTADKKLNDGLLRLIADAGCTYITHSLETVSPEGLKKINKKIGPNTVANKCRIAKENKMKVGLYVMFGMHDDEQEDFFWAQKTLDKVAEIKPDFVSYAILADYPNSNPDLPYETKKFGTEEVWKFFDEGCAYHPNCNVKYAEKIRGEVIRRHNTNLKNVKRF